MTAAVGSIRPRGCSPLPGSLPVSLWSGVGSAIIYKIVDYTVGLRPTVEQEREGLDLNDHGERAYNM